MKTLIKICGVTSAQDAFRVSRAVVAFMGLIFAPESPRCVSLSQAAEIVEARVPGLLAVGVFQDQSQDFIERAVSEASLDYLQLHGCESPELCNALPRPVIKTITYEPDWTPDQLKAAMAPYLPRENPNIHFLLLDAPKRVAMLPAQRERLLATFYEDGSLAAIPHFLAGGLTPETVGPLLRAFHPVGVDVASGVEASVGVKDPDKLQRFRDAVLQFE
ncbi:MAG: phosphoribosylanthranilate isomerase [Vampirovibrionales bacterium]|nr:phosphoribosylanthranilate isomerase [Vampirovibrionales bacterium]